MSRIINEYIGHKSGALFIVFGAMHGNEIAGVKAIKRVFELIDDEPSKNPDFCFYGKMIGVIGNLKAYEKGVRFLVKDMNRHWKKAHIDFIKTANESELDAEDLEMIANLELINREVEKYKPSKLYILDLHTTSAQGGIFTIPSTDAESVKIALDIHAPVVQGFLKGLQGTTLHYFTSETFGLPTTAVTFEAGQHENKESIKNATSAIINCLRAIGCVEKQYIELKHNNWLYHQSKNLPNLTRITHRHAIEKGDNFVMLPDFKNFQFVPKNTLLATDKNGEIRNKEDAHLLMPLYQKQGEDGFFLVKEMIY
jgi:succinylglutamate desuccinylase